MKYIVIVNGSTNTPELFIFPARISHDVFSDYIARLKEGKPNWKRHYENTIAAGFTDGRRCFGRSESLNLDSRGRLDEMLITG